MKNRKLRKVYPLALENLEARLPLAGNVFIRVSGGNLKITGDDGDNAIQVNQIAAGTFEVVAGNGETLFFNGAAYAGGTDFGGVTKNITIDMKGGDDTAVVGGLGTQGGNPTTAQNISIKGGKGADQVGVGNAKITGKVTLDTRAGDSEAGSATASNLLVGSNLSIKTGKGGDTIQIAAVNVTGKTQVQMGDGADNLVVQLNCIFNAFDLNSGKGIDNLNIAGSEASMAKIRTGDDNDTLNLNAVEVDKLDVDLGKGDDVVGIFANGLIVNGPQTSKVKGGLGTDTINGTGFVTGLAFITDPTTTGVENVNV